MAENFKKSIFDSVHGFTNLTRTEDRIINSPYFQRLRWIKQLGWSHYIYPGATHTRFEHALGVLHVMDRIVKAINRGVDDDKLFNTKIRDAKTMFHRKMRLAAMLHDIGSFPFSHSIEHGYITHSRHQIGKGKKISASNHEILGSHIINHTNFEGGITHILKSDGFDPKELSNLIRGESESALANQLIHSDIDADRIDYLQRDAHHTGLKYGVFDMEYLISNMKVCKVSSGHGRSHEVLAINESALTAVEYFLISRYTWYSQIINEGTGYKFDLLASRIAEYFIESGLVFSFDELLRQVSTSPHAFFGFNDSYFTSKLQEALDTKRLEKTKLSPLVSEMIEMLMFRQPPKQIKLGPFQASLIKDEEERVDLIENIHNAVEWLRFELKSVPSAWVIEDIPSRDVIFTKNGSMLKKGPKSKVEFQDSVRIVDRDQKLKLLIDMPHSVVRILSNYRNFIPRVYVSRNTYKILEAKGLLKELEEKFGIEALGQSGKKSA